MGSAVNDQTTQRIPLVCKKCEKQFVVECEHEHVPGFSHGPHPHRIDYPHCGEKKWTPKSGQRLK